MAVTSCFFNSVGISPRLCAAVLRSTETSELLFVFLGVGCLGFYPLSTSARIPFLFFTVQIKKELSGGVSRIDMLMS